MFSHIYLDTFLCVNLFALLADIIKEQNRELRGTQRAITRDRAALEKQEKQLVSEGKSAKAFSVFVYVYGDVEMCTVQDDDLLPIIFSSFSR